MATLSVWKFDSADGAEHALRTLVTLQSQHLIRIEDASIVSWPAGRPRPRAWQVRDMRGVGALSGAFWGLLFGLLFLLPLVGLAVGAAAGATAGMLAHVGLADEPMQRIRDEVTPGTSGLFLLTSEEVVDRIREAFGQEVAELLTSNLSREQEERLRAAFSGDDEHAAGHELSAAR